LEEVLKIINPMTSTIFWTIVIFVIVIFIFWRFILKPVDNIISRRKSEIRKSIDIADKQKEDAAKYIEEQKRITEEARNNAKIIVEDSKKEARKIKEEIEEKAREKSKIMVAEALAEIKTERERSINSAKDEMIEIAMMATEKVISKSLSEEEHKKLIEKSLKEAGKV